MYIGQKQDHIRDNETYLTIGKINCKLVYEVIDDYYFKQSDVLCMTSLTITNNPNMAFNISKDTKNKINIFTWTGNISQLFVINCRTAVAEESESTPQRDST